MNSQKNKRESGTATDSQKELGEGGLATNSQNDDNDGNYGMGDEHSDLRVDLPEGTSSSKQPLDSQEKVTREVMEILFDKILHLQKLRELQEDCQTVYTAMKWDSRERRVPKNTTLGYIKIWIGGEWRQALVDTGANTGIFPKDLYNELAPCNNWHIPPHQNISVRVVGGATTPALGKIKIPFKVENCSQKLHYRFTVMDHDEILIGLDFLKTHGAIWDFLDDYITLRYPAVEVSVQPLQSHNSAKTARTLIATHKRIVPPLTTTAVDVEARNLVDSIDQGWVIPHPTTDTQTHPLTIGRGLQTLHQGLTLVAIQNETLTPVTIEVGQALAVFVPDEDEYLIHEDPFGVNQLQSSPVYVYKALTEDETVHLQSQVQHTLNHPEEYVDLDSSTLNAEGRNRFRRLLMKYDNLFITPQTPEATPDCPQYRVTNWVEHAIKLKPGTTPHSQGPYRATPPKRKIIEGFVEELLKNGCIRPCSSPWSAPCLVIPKKTPGKYRFAIDYRKLNQATIRDSFYLPRLEEAQECVQGAKVYSSLDLASAYWTVPMRKDDQEKTTFVTHTGTYAWNVQPMGLANSGSVFARLVNACLIGLNWTHCLAFSDDILCWASDNNGMFDILERVFERLQAAGGLRLNLEKCDFFKTEITYLGHIFTPEGMKMSPQRVEAIMKYPQPKTRKQLKSFCCLAAHYRRFIHHFSQRIRPLQEKTSGEWDGKWTLKMIQTFTDVKTALASAPILVHPDFNEPFVLRTDASKIGAGAVLYQKDSEGSLRPVMFASKSFTKRQSDYAAHERECLAIMYALEVFHAYLENAPFIIETDSAAITWLLKPDSQKPIKSKYSRWVMKLSAYDYTIRHRPGSSMTDADPLSRAPLSIEDADKAYGEIKIDDIYSTRLIFRAREKVRKYMKKNEYECCSVELQEDDCGTTTVPEGLREMAAAQRMDEELAPLIRYMAGTGHLSLRQKRKARDQVSTGKYFYDTGTSVLYRVTGRLNDVDSRVPVIPKQLRERYLALFHNTPLAGHMGFDKALALMVKRVYWKGMGKDLRAWIKACLPCREKKSHSLESRVGKLAHIVVQQPHQMWSLDIVGPLKKTKDGNDHIITFIDHFTGFPEAVAVSGTPTAEMCAEALHQQVVTRYGCPRQLLSDRGTQFTSDLFQHICKRLGIDKIQTTAYAPQCNGKVEKLHLFLQTAMYSFVDKNHSNWDRYLHSALMAYRVAPLAKIGLSPAYLMYGIEPTLPLDVIHGPKTIIRDDVVRFRSRVTEELKIAFDVVKELREKDRIRSAQRYDHPPRPKERTNPSYQVGSQVLLRVFTIGRGLTKKFSPKWRGPFIVIRKCSDLTYELQSDHDDSTFVVNVRRLLPYEPWTPIDEQSTTESLFPEKFGMLPKVKDKNPLAPLRKTKKRKKTSDSERQLPPSTSVSRYGRKRKHQPLFRDGIVTGFYVRQC